MNTSHIAFEVEPRRGAYNLDVERALLDNKTGYRNFAGYNSSPADLDWYRPLFAPRPDKNFYDYQLTVFLTSQKPS